MSEAGFRVKEERQLEVHGGLIGEYRKGLFEAVSNFAVKPVGLVRDSINGYTWIAVFPKKKKKTRFFVPCSDYTRPSRFVAHLQEQYPFQVECLHVHFGGMATGHLRFKTDELIF